MKYSKQRELILNAISGHPIHPTADYIYSHLRVNYPNISLGTVYRNLNLLTQNKVIHKIYIPDGSDRFDNRLDEHYHIVCQECGGVFDVEIDSLWQLDRQVEQNTGFTVTKHNLILNGICSQCKQFNK